MRHFAHNRRRRGAALALVVLLSVILTGLVLALASAAGGQVRRAATTIHHDQAFYAAEAGLQRVAWHAKHGSIGSLSQPYTGTLDNASYAVTWTSASGSYTITATGTRNTANATVSAVCTPPTSGGSAGLTLNSSLAMWGNGNGTFCYIDAYDSSRGAYGDGTIVNDGAVVSTNATTADAVQMNKAIIKGALKVGPGGNPNTVVNTYGTSSITGGVSAASAATSMPGLPTVPATPASSGYWNIWSGSNNVISGTKRYSGGSISGNKTKITVSGHAVLRIDGDIGFSDKVELDIPEGSSLTIYAYGNVGVSNQAQINADGRPGQLKIYMMGNDKQLLQTDQTTLAARVENPNGTMGLWGNGNSDKQSQFYGSFVGQRLDMGDMTRIHLDVSEDDSSGGGGSTAMTLTAFTGAMP